MKKFIFLLLLVLIFTSCKRERENDITEENISFNISTPAGTTNVDIQAAAGRLDNVQVNIETYLWEERAEHFDRILSQFAAGVGPDVFVRDTVLLFQFIENGFIQDIYPL